jgi:hypothetical protein
LSTTFQYLVVRDAGDGKAAARAAVTMPGAVTRQLLVGWTVVSASELLAPADFAHVATVASESGSLVVGVYSERGDFGYCVGASDGEVAFHVVLKDNSALNYPEGEWALELCFAMAGSPNWKEEAARRVQDWAARIPEALTAEAVLVMLNKHWIHAEDAVAEFVELLGIPPVNVSALLDWRRKQERNAAQ